MADISTEISALQAASRGSEVRQTVVDALNKINQDVLPAVTSADSGKYLVVNSNGEWDVGDVSIPSATGVTF